MRAWDLFRNMVSPPVAVALSVLALLVFFYLVFLRGKRTGSPFRVYLCEKRAGNCLSSREMLEDALLQYCEDFRLPCGQGDLAICEAEHGKPYAVRRSGEGWVPRDDLFFSVSHTRGWWVCAVCGQPVGADVEERDRRVSPEVLERCFTDEEREWLRENGTTRDHMLKLWVRKEAYVKYLGTGLSEGMQSFSTVKDGWVTDVIGQGEKAAFCSPMLPDRMEDLEGYPVPLVGAFCTRFPPDGVELGFLERLQVVDGKETGE